MMYNVTDARTVDLAELTAELFDPYVGQMMVFERPAGSEAEEEPPARMTLLEVHRGIPSPALRRVPFSLLFVMKDQAELSFGLHRLILSGHTPVELLISRVTVPKFQASDPMGMFYEVVFG
jgi:hypothetical protein